MTDLTLTHTNQSLVLTRPAQVVELRDESGAQVLSLSKVGAVLTLIQAGGGGAGVTTYATEALLLSAAPDAGSLGYATDTLRFWERTGTAWRPVDGEEVVSAITLAVSTSGSDTSAVRPSRIVSGDWSACPFATIQAAVNALPLASRMRPSFASHAQINVGAGAFAGFAVCGSSLSMAITGTRQTATLASGATSGTATAGDSRTLTFAGAGWTVNDLVGRYINVTSGPGVGVHLVAKNTADTLTLPYYANPALGAGSVFTVQDLATVLSSVPAGGYNGLISVQASSGYIQISDFKTTYAGATVAGVVASLLAGTMIVSRVASIGNRNGFSHSSGGVLWLASCYAESSTYTGFSCQNVIFSSPYSCLARNCPTGFSYSNGVPWTFVGSGNGNMAISCTYGFYFEGIQVLLSKLLCEGCGYGLYFVRCAGRSTSFNADGCTISPVYMRDSRLTFQTLLSGSDNAGFGLDARGVGNFAEISGITPTITGALGDATVDGVNAVYWDDIETGDAVVDAATGARIVRQ